MNGLWPGSGSSVGVDELPEAGRGVALPAFSILNEPEAGRAVEVAWLGDTNSARLTLTVKMLE